MKKTTIIVVSLVVAATHVVAATPPEPINVGPEKLFSIPDTVGSIEYLNARDSAAQYVARIGAPGVVRSQVLMRNQSGIDELVWQIETKPDGFGTSFDVTPFADVPCTISSIDYTSPKVIAGLAAPDRYQAEARCDNSGAIVTVAVNKSQGLVSFGLRLGVNGFAIMPLDDSGYSVAYQVDPNGFSGGAH